MKSALAIAVSFVVLAPHAALASPHESPGHASVSDRSDLEKAEHACDKLQKSFHERALDPLLHEIFELSRKDQRVRGRLEATLLEMWRLDHEELARPRHARPYAELIEARERLDHEREGLLRLIRDEERYPYPFREGEAPKADTERHELAQLHIDVGVERMLEIWDGARPVVMSKTVRQHGGRILWMRTAVRLADEEIDFELELPEHDCPTFFHGLPYETKQRAVTIAEFALDFEEGVQFAVDRVIASTIELEFDARIDAAEDFAARDRFVREKEEVVLTNEYRQLFGLHALGNDWGLHAAARFHAEYNERTGSIGHVQPGGGLETYYARAASFGYPNARFENAATAIPSAQECHAAWTHSSAHHRALLHSEVTEASTGVEKATWIQLLGSDELFRASVPCPAWQAPTPSTEKHTSVARGRRRRR